VSRVSPERITQGRELAGLSKTDLADRLDVSPAAVAQWESGAKNPTADNLAAISAALGIPMALLMKPKPAGLSIRGPLSFRARNNAQIRRMNRKATTLAEMVAEVFLWLDERIAFPVANLPVLRGEMMPDDAATHCRREWNLGDRPILKLGELLESNGIILGSAVFNDERFDAFSCVLSSRPFIFLGSEKGDRARSRFDAAHELGHLILHQHLSECDLRDAALHKRVEAEANAFAGSFLMPESTFKQDVINLSLEGFLKMKPRWGVSAQAMIFRSRELGIISDSQYTELFRQISMKGWRKARREPLDDQVPAIQSSLGKRSLELLEKNAIIHAWEIPSELPLPISILTQVFQAGAHEFRPAANIISLSSYSVSGERNDDQVAL